MILLLKAMFMALTLIDRAGNKGNENDIKS